MSTQSAFSPSETPNTQEETKDYLSKLIETKGDQWQDPQVIAKGYLSAQEYIQNLENQNKELMEDTRKGATVEEILKELRGTNKPSTERAPTGGAEVSTSTEVPGNTKPEMSEEKLRELVLSTLSSQEKEKIAQTNVQAVDSKLSEIYGTGAGEAVAKRAKELGMSVDRMRDIASESPDAFFSMMGTGKQSESTPQRPSINGSVNTSTNQFAKQGGERNADYYNNLRRTDRRAYYSAQTQRQMFEDRKRMGADFYKK